MRRRMHEMLMELRKLRAVKQDGSRFLTYISKKQREIFQGMGIKEESIVIS